MSGCAFQCSASPTRSTSPRRRPSPATRRSGSGSSSENLELSERGRGQLVAGRLDLSLSPVTTLGDGPDECRRGHADLAERLAPPRLDGPGAWTRDHELDDAWPARGRARPPPARTARRARGGGFWPRWGGGPGNWGLFPPAAGDPDRRPRGRAPARPCPPAPPAGRPPVRFADASADLEQGRAVGLE